MKKLFKNPLILLAVAALLIAGSTVGATRAALNATSDRDDVAFSTGKVSVELIESGEVVRDNNETNESQNKPLDLGIGEDQFKIGKSYADNIAVKNDSTVVVTNEDGEVTNTYHYDEYVRVIVTKSWYSGNGKDTLLDPSLIELNVLTNNGWILDEASSTAEQTVYYYSRPVQYDEEIPFANSFMVKPEVTTKITKNGTVGNISTSYDYDGKSFEVDIKVDAVQTHHAQEAILGAWGVNVEIAEDGTLSLIATTADTAINETITDDAVTGEE